MNVSNKTTNNSLQEMPLIYSLYQQIHRVLSLMGGFSIFQKFPSIILRNYLNRLMYHSVLNADKTFLVEAKDNFLIKLPMNDQAAASILFERQYDPQQVQVLLKLFNFCPCFLDVGANLGYFFLLHLAHTNGAGLSLAIEPNYNLCNLIQDSMELNHFKNGQVIHAAAGAVSGKGVLHLDPRLSSNAYICPQLDYQKALVNAVDIVTLDEVIEIDTANQWLIKIDVEGLELEVLKGSAKSLIRKSIFVIEVSKRTIQAVETLINPYGYVVLDFFGNCRTNTDFHSLGKQNIILSPSSYLKDLMPFLKS